MMQGFANCAILGAHSPNPATRSALSNSDLFAHIDLADVEQIPRAAHLVHLLGIALAAAGHQVASLPEVAFPHPPVDPMPHVKLARRLPSG
jgi:hypothetical protein